MTKPSNPVVDRAMRAVFKAWQDEMYRNGKVSVLNSRFEDIAPRDRRLIEIQCRAAIASLKEESDVLVHAIAAVVQDERSQPVSAWPIAKKIITSFIDAALKP